MPINKVTVKELSDRIDDLSNEVDKLIKEVEHVNQLFNVEVAKTARYSWALFLLGAISFGWFVFLISDYFK